MVQKNRLKRSDFIFVESGDAFQPFQYSVGMEGSRFFAEIRDHKKFLGLRCPSCRKVYVPPRKICGPCFKTMEEWVEVGPMGTLSAFTILRFPFIDPETGEKKPVPYGYGFILLDGASTQFQHFLKVDPDWPPSIGIRVKPVFAEDRQGKLSDILHFEAA